MVYITNSEAETEALGARLAAAWPDGTVIAFYGELGSGKTAFVRGMARGMGIAAPVSSPTFTIVNEYLGSRSLFHFDMYRLGDADELYAIGWEDYLRRPGICAVEWTENIEEALEGNEILVRFEKTGDNSRRILVEGGDGPC